MRNVNCVICFAAVLFLFHSCSSEPEVVDVNKEVKIGTQVWMQRNLNVLYFRNGDPIPIVKDTGEWRKAGENKQPACCYCDNDSKNGEKYGVLYNWYAVADKRGLAPEGWHVPSAEEWTKLIDFLGGDSIAVTKLKSTEGWESYDGDITCPACRTWDQNKKASDTCFTCNDKRVIKGTISDNGNNSSGFTALPCGSRFEDGSFFTFVDFAFWWGSSKRHYADAWTIVIGSNRRNVEYGYDNKEMGYSVRCLRD